MFRTNRGAGGADDPEGLGIGSSGRLSIAYCQRKNRHYGGATPVLLKWPPPRSFGVVPKPRFGTLAGSFGDRKLAALRKTTDSCCETSRQFQCACARRGAHVVLTQPTHIREISGNHVVGEDIPESFR